MIGNMLGPDEAFRFARGKKVRASMGAYAQLVRPLDFLVVAEHAENLGLAPMIAESNPQLLANDWGRKVHDLVKDGLEAHSAPAVVVFLGDNIYPRGMPDSTSPRRPEMERRIDAQLHALDGTMARGIFIPGNHDWMGLGNEGWDAIREQQRYVDRTGAPYVSMLPTGSSSTRSRAPHPRGAGGVPAAAHRVPGFRTFSGNEIVHMETPNNFESAKEPCYTAFIEKVEKNSDHRWIRRREYFVNNPRDFVIEVQLQDIRSFLLSISRGSPTEHAWLKMNQIRSNSFYKIFPEQVFEEEITQLRNRLLADGSG
jgi:hypothetical protein